MTHQEDPLPGDVVIVTEGTEPAQPFIAESNKTQISLGVIHKHSVTRSFGCRATWCVDNAECTVCNLYLRASTVLVEMSNSGHIDMIQLWNMF